VSEGFKRLIEKMLEVDWRRRVQLEALFEFEWFRQSCDGCSHCAPPSPTNLAGDPAVTPVPSPPTPAPSSIKCSEGSEIAIAPSDSMEP
jgi:hypothetical protein